MINSVDEAARLVEYTSYAPMGGRSFGPIRAGLVDGPHYQASANQRVIRFAMIETRKALDQLDAILQVEGLDAIYVGPSDLSLSLGCKPTLDDVEPTVQQAIEHILERAHAHGLKAGIHSQTVNFAKARKALGYDLVTTASDLRLILAGAQDLMKAWRAP
jgi:4-hydroxy-2-oxoheptanedioate aldolase